MTLLDTLCHEYGWTFEYALACSLARACALYAACASRYGQELQGPSFEEQEMIAELEARQLKKAKANHKPGEAWVP